MIIQFRVVPISVKRLAIVAPINNRNVWILMLIRTGAKVPLSVLLYLESIKSSKF